MISLQISDTIDYMEYYITMSYATEHIAGTLKAARKNKGLSQRELSKSAGMPQGHISKIENDAVDLRLSSLISLARVLDLELTLVPRQALPAVKSIARISERPAGDSGETSRQASNELRRIQDTASKLAETIAAPELERIQRRARDLQHFTVPSAEFEALKAVNQTLQAFSNDPENPNALRQALSQLQSVREALARSSADVSRIESVRPAYSLDENDDG